MYPSGVALRLAKPPLQVIVVGSLFESGGRAVTRPLKRTIWPSSEIVGARPLFEMADGADPGDNAGFEIVRANAKGDLLAASGLKLKLLRELRNYNWRWVSGTGWQADYLSKWETVEERDLDLKAGERTRYDARVDWGGYRLEIFDPATQLTTRIPFNAGWNWYNEGQDRGSRPDKVKLAMECVACHQHDDVHFGRFGRQCSRCHETTSFRQVRRH